MTGNANPLNAGQHEAGARLVAELEEKGELDVYRASISRAGQDLFFLARRDGEKVIGVVGDPDGFSGEARPLLQGNGHGRFLICPVGPENLAALRRRLPFLRPRPLGLTASFGCGDRLGVATPGHVRAMRKGRLAPIFAQQSVRENARTARTPQDVLDDATLGVFQEGWRRGYGADADHLKHKADVDSFLQAGYTLFTIDPGDHVDESASGDPPTVIREKYERLPWQALETTPDDALRRYTATAFDFAGLRLRPSLEEFQRAACKYGRAVAHTLRMARHISAKAAGAAVEIEMSVDETEEPTTFVQHLFVASELRRLGVKLVSLAPRYRGRYEKGVDFIGELEQFADDFAGHLALARGLGPYKLSLHSGSDKFSLYPAMARLAPEGLIHVKTAGTSYLEALRTVALVAPDLFRRILIAAHAHFETDRKSYHISAERSRAPDPARLQASQFPSLFEDFHSRQILHVTYGSVLQHPELGPELHAVLRRHERAYHDHLLQHFEKHLAPFADLDGTTSWQTTASSE